MVAIVLVGHVGGLVRHPADLGPTGVLLLVTGDGAAYVLFTSLLVPLAISCCQRRFPLLRLKHVASSVSLDASTPERNTRSCQIIGVAAEEPSSSMLQTTPSVVVHLEGRFFSSVEPLKYGPRQ